MSPIMTALTTISAAWNMPQGDRSRGNCSAIAGSDAACAQAAAGKASRSPIAAAGRHSFRMRENPVHFATFTRPERPIL